MTTSIFINDVSMALINRDNLTINIDVHNELHYSNQIIISHLMSSSVKQIANIGITLLIMLGIVIFSRSSRMHL